ncbi:MAG: sporulation transcription factor Spo0A [Bacilli bacterium]|nr:sporulation transcription factor Spo0A [Bacilli bacterium]
MKEKENKEIRVFVVDDNENLVGMIKEYFKGHSKVKIAHEAYDGEAAIKKIEQNKDDFDVLLLDLIMPKKDGIAVLEYLNEKNINKPIIVGTSFNADETIAKVSKYNPKYFVLKPFDMVDLENKILNAVSINNSSDSKINLYHNNLEITTTKLLHGLGVPSHIKGYQYIREGVLLMYENPDIVGAITKELYPEIAKRYDTTVSRVERAIRHAIEVSWNRGDIDLMEEIFGHSVDYDRAKPTNSEFIVTVSDKLRLEFSNMKQKIR